MTRAGSTLFESLTRRSVRLAKFLRKIVIVLDQNRRTRQSLKRNERPANQPFRILLTVKDALDVYIKDMIPSLLFREIFIGTTPDNSRMIN